MTEPTVEQALRVIRKIESCEGDAVKLVLLKNFMLKSETRLREGLRELAERWDQADDAFTNSMGERCATELRALLSLEGDKAGPKEGTRENEHD